MSETLHAVAQTHHHHHAHGHHHGHHHVLGAGAARDGGFSLLALSSPARFALCVPIVSALWLLTFWALHG